MVIREAVDGRLISRVSRRKMNSLGQKRVDSWRCQGGIKYTIELRGHAPRRRFRPTWMTCENEGWKTPAGFLGYFPSTVGCFKLRQIPRSLQNFFAMSVNTEKERCWALVFLKKKRIAPVVVMWREHLGQTRE